MKLEIPNVVKRRMRETKKERQMEWLPWEARVRKSSEVMVWWTKKTKCIDGSTKRDRKLKIDWNKIPNKNDIGDRYNLL